MGHRVATIMRARRILITAIHVLHVTVIHIAVIHVSMGALRCSLGITHIAQ